ncbi:MAG: 2-oxoacid:acceptor oxidoreductase subunit alpha [Dehalococcoidia bacterium]|nr:2-oxoacid:acceptor oxidoreductase subunit alpha [Dehalococcoidia bacterium]MCA9856880.1 2-oxoacid:acceptor oxidoreductase subunit alpha [Dehalococcoidia bacterium]MCB9484021.1 2-oxoacid:acceptor oxidoreductase subunit alpha [Dehalococcoidia bacterium]MCB9490480.1 2-oxoacid:acceptor oxidoreductase subunit alpha [Dehalococcoidia bacterium]
MSKNLVVRFAGEGGQGVVGGAELMASAAASGGYHVLTFSTFPSQIKGGPAWGQARISSEPILTPGDYLDVLVAQNQYAYDHNLEDLREGGLVVYNSEEFEVADNARALGIPADRMAREAGNPLASTIILIGAVAKMAGVSIEALEAFITKRWSRGRPGDEAIVEGNINALRMGVEVAEKAGLSLEDLDPAPAHAEPRVLIRGYEAAALGAMAGGVDSFIGYPISPATTMLVYMESNLVGKDKFVGQASSEIEAINALVGTGFAGKKVMTSTAGPGVSLMGEGLGLAWMAEIPLVVVDVQRGGPATGLPTKTEQSDLTMAMNPGHGDMSTPVIACGSTEEAFWGAMHALNWAERYQGPVLFLSEASIAERAQDIPMPDLSQVVDERRVVSKGEQGNRRYAGDGVSPFPVPGGPGAYVANASEHDEQGDTTHLPDIHVTMTERRFKKLELLNDGTYEAENTDADTVVLTWGGSKGSALAAWRELDAEGVKVGWYYTMFLNPLPAKMLEELKGKRILVPELNYMGQFAAYLRSKGLNAEAITQYTGLPFKVADLKAEIKRRVQA